MSKQLIAICLVVLIACPVAAQAATYYVDGSASNDSGDGSQGNPKKYIESGIALLSSSGGDTLTIANGTYSTSSDQITNIPNGQAGSYNVIQAATDFGVTITASSGLLMDHEDAYIQIQGIKFNYASGKTILGNHVKVLRCSFVGGAASGNVANVGIGTSDYNDTEYILIEDCYSYGSGGRYNFLVYNSDYIILRRCVVRHDGGWDDEGSGNPEAAFNAYSSSHVYFQNCIAIDCDLGTYSTWYSGFYATEDGAESDVQWQGCISINNNNGLLWVDPKSGGALTDFIVNNCALYDANGGSAWISSYGSSGTATGTMTNITSGGSDNGYGEWGTRTLSIADSIIFDISSNAIDGGVSASYCDIEGGGETCSNCQTYDPESNGLLYLTRIEDASNLKTAGNGGGQIGATILKKIGVSETLYGDTGYATVTDDDLWPFPNEDRIKTDMAAVSTRGFCGTGKQLNGMDDITLTSYIWEYLGNQIPSDIYGSSPSTPSLHGVSLHGVDMH